MANADVGWSRPSPSARLPPLPRPPAASPVAAARGRGRAGVRAEGGAGGVRGRGVWGVGVLRSAVVAGRSGGVWPWGGGAAVRVCADGVAWSRCVCWRSVRPDGAGPNGRASVLFGRRAAAASREETRHSDAHARGSVERSVGRAVERRAREGGQRAGRALCAWLERGGWPGGTGQGGGGADREGGAHSARSRPGARSKAVGGPRARGGGGGGFGERESHRTGSCRAAPARPQRPAEEHSSPLDSRASACDDARQE